MKNSENDNKKICEEEMYKQNNATAELIKLLEKRGVVSDSQISDERIRELEQERKRKMYHNTQLMLQHYRDIAWALECFPEDIAAELNSPLGDLDALISLVSNELEHVQNIV